MTLALEDLPDDVAALKAMLVAARAETATLQAQNAVFATEVKRLKAQAERFAHILRSLRRAHFGRSSEKISDDQLNLALEDVSTGFSVEDAKAEAANTIVKQAATEKRRTNRGHLPAHLPREEIVVEPESKACPCCGGTLHVIGEDTSERLDKIPAKLRVLVTRRPKYACRSLREDRRRPDRRRHPGAGTGPPDRRRAADRGARRRRARVEIRRSSVRCTGRARSLRATASISIARRCATGSASRPSSSSRCMRIC